MKYTISHIGMKKRGCIGLPKTHKRELSDTVFMVQKIKINVQFLSNKHVHDPFTFML